MCKTRNQNLPSSGEKLTSNVFSALGTQHPLNLMWLKNMLQVSSFPLFVTFGQETVFYIYEVIGDVEVWKS